MIKLKKGDIVDIVAPAGFAESTILIKAVTELKKWGLVPRTFIDFTAFHPFHSDDDEIRFLDLKRALEAKDSKVIWCLRGGYGSGRLISMLDKMKKPKNAKIVIGYSDITSIHTFLNQNWKWESIHGPTISTFSDKNFEKSCFTELRNILFGKKEKLEFFLEAVNDAALNSKGIIKGNMAGGNLAMIQTLIGTKIALKAQGKILMIEDVNERGFRIDRILNHLEVTNSFKGCKAIIFGDFSNGLEKNGESYVDFAITRFALNTKIPVFTSNDFGHGKLNRPLIFNREYKIKDSLLSSK